MSSQTQIGLLLLLASVLMFFIGIEIQHVGMFLLSFPVGFVGFYNALRPWVRDRQRKEALDLMRYEENRRQMIRSMEDSN